MADAARSRFGPARPVGVAGSDVAGEGCGRAGDISPCGGRHGGPDRGNSRRGSQSARMGRSARCGVGAGSVRVSGTARQWPEQQVRRGPVRDGGDGGPGQGQQTLAVVAGGSGRVAARGPPYGMAWGGRVRVRMRRWEAGWG